MITVFNNNVTIEQVRDIPMVRPENVGRLWQGLPHGELVDTILEEVQGRGWVVSDKRFSVGHDGADLVGALDFASVGDLTPPEGISFALGFQTDNRCWRALKLFVGGEVTVCTNGLVTGEIILRRKHTIGLSIKEEICKAIDSYTVSAKCMSHHVESLRQRHLSNSQWEHIVMEAGRQGVIPGSRLLRLDSEFRNPRHAEHGTNTSWTALQAYTEVVKKSPVHAQMELINSFRAMLPVAAV